jgi:hypothetical protein
VSSIRIDFRVGDDPVLIDNEPCRDWKRPTILPVKAWQIDSALQMQCLEELGNAPTNAELQRELAAFVAQDW